MTPHTARARLDTAIGPLRDLLTARQFSASQEQGVSSAGPFAVTTFRRGSIEIGFIVRGEALGCPNYSIGTGYVGHSDLMAAFGSAGTEALVPGEGLAYRARDGGDSFAALIADFRHLVLPVLDLSEAGFRDAVAQALVLQTRKRGW